MRGPALFGQKFGRLVVVKKAVKGWECLCSCGAVVPVRGYCLTSGHTQSCGCLHRENVATLHRHHKNVLKHGATRVGRREREYASWRMMQVRCDNPEDRSYANYGGRGITVWPAWRDYLTFRADMGSCPPGQTLERKEVNGNYEPDNCMWATRKTQALNKRNNVQVDYLGRRQPLGAWCDELGIQYAQAYYRIVSRGWSMEETVKLLKEPT